MTDLISGAERVLLWMVEVGVGLAVVLTAAVVVERVALAWVDMRTRRISAHYGPLIRRALAGDEDAMRALVDSPARNRLPIGRLLVLPLIGDRDPARIAATRGVVRAMSLEHLADRMRRSRRWWRRTVGLRALGLLQDRAYTARIVGALDDPNHDVRDAALDALADMQDPAALPAIVVRLHDASLQRGRRAAALAAFGSQCESLLLDLASIDPEQRLNYVQALGICGTGASRPMLCEWTGDGRADVRAAAFDTLARIGIDEPAAALAIRGLESDEVAVRSMAAAALRGWPGGGDAAAQLARHLDDDWTVAVNAARALQSMHLPGRLELEARAGRQDLPGVLARQMLWESQAQW